MSSRNALSPELPAPNDRLLWDVWMSSYHFPALTVADEMNLFPFLASTPATLEDVAHHLALGPRGSEALLGVLTSLGFLVQHAGRFHLTDTSRVYLLPESPYYYGSLLQIYRDHPMTHAALRESLHAEQPFVYDDYGDVASTWEAGDLTADQAEGLTTLMHSHSFPAAMGVARWGTFEGCHRLLDVAGGSACFSIALALRYPDMHFTVLELPAVCRITERYITEYGLNERIDTQPGNVFTDQWPHGYDAVFLSNVLHDWDRASCLHLARRAFEALPSGRWIYIHEMLLNATKDGPLPATSFSLLMAWATRGKQFTAGELEDLLQEAGFTDTVMTPSYAYYSLLSARKP